MKYTSKETRRINQPVREEGEVYTCNKIPLINGMSRRIKGAFCQEGMNTGDDITGLNNYRIHRVVTVAQVLQWKYAGKTVEIGIKKLPTLSKKDKAIAPKIKQVEKKEILVLIRIKFPQVFVENKGLEEICRPAFTGILDF